MRHVNKCKYDFFWPIHLVYIYGNDVEIVFFEYL